MRRLVATVLLVLWLPACGDDAQERGIVGKWVMTDPGGELLGGTVEFSASGSVTVVEVWRTETGPKETTLTGTYLFIEERRMRMELREAGGPQIRRVVAVAVTESRLSLGFRGGSVVYRRQ